MSDKRIFDNRFLEEGKEAKSHHYHSLPIIEKIRKKKRLQIEILNLF